MDTLTTLALIFQSLLAVPPVRLLAALTDTGCASLDYRNAGTFGIRFPNGLLC